MAVGIKRFAIAAMLAIVALIAALAAASLTINTGAMRNAVEADIRTATGLDFEIRGDVSATLFPAGALTFHDVRLKSDDADMPALTIGELKANLRVLPLLFGRYHVADLALSGAQISVIRQADGTTNWSGIVKRLIEPLKQNPARRSFSEIRIVDGKLIYRDQNEGTVETLSDVDASLAWPSISRTFGATGQFVWHGKKVEISFSLGDFLAAVSGEQSGIKLRLTSALLKAAFDGTASRKPDLLAEGTLTMDAASLREAMRWAGREPPLQDGLGRFALKAKTALTRTAINLSDVNLELDGNLAEGVLSYSSDGRKTLQGTLAAEALNFSPYLTNARRARTDSNWSRKPFNVDTLAATDVDMRLSAAQISLGTTKLGRTAIAANTNGGNLTLSIGEAQVFSGLLKGSIGIAKADGGARLRTQLQFTDVDLEACGQELFGLRKLSGKGNLSLALDSSGGNMYELARALNGTALLTGQDGALNGFNVEALLRRLERRPLSGAGSFRNGQTDYKSLNVAVRFTKGVAEAEDVQMESPAVRLRMTGTASVPNREFDLKGTASLLKGAGSAPTETLFELPFVVQGPWDDPLLLPVPDILIRRSPASAPLLDSIREKNTRDAVRSAIERLTGRKMPIESPKEGAPQAPDEGKAAPTDTNATPPGDAPQAQDDPAKTQSETPAPPAADKLPELPQSEPPAPAGAQQ